MLNVATSNPNLQSPPQPLEIPPEDAKLLGYWPKRDDFERVRIVLWFACTCIKPLCVGVGAGGPDVGVHMYDAWVDRIPVSINDG